MDKLEAMSILIQVAANGSFSEAGRTLHTPVSTINRKISELEKSLGAKLLVRTTRRLELTDAGRAYVTAARTIISLVDEAGREAAGEFVAPKGELVITAPVQFGQLYVLPVVSDFLAAFPEINIRLTLLDQNVRLVEDHVDLAIRIGMLPASSMIATKVGTMRTVVCASPSFLASRKPVTKPADLEGIPCIAFESLQPTPFWKLRNPTSRNEISIQIRTRLSVTTVESAVSAAIRGVGAARLFYYQAATGIRNGELELVLEDYEPEPLPVSLLHADRGELPLKMRAFLDFAVPRLRRAISSVGDVASFQKVANGSRDL